MDAELFFSETWNMNFPQHLGFSESIHWSSNSCSRSVKPVPSAAQPGPGGDAEPTLWPAWSSSEALASSCHTSGKLWFPTLTAPASWAEGAGTGIVKGAGGARQEVAHQGG